MAEEKGTILGSQASIAIVSRLAADDTVPWYRKPNLRILYLLFLPTCIGVEMTSGIDSSMMNGLQAVDSWDKFYHSPRSTLLGLMTAAYPLGSILALPLVPYVNDEWGRKRAIFFGSILMIIGAVLQTVSQTFAMFVVSRLILGIGIPFAIVAASALIGELAHPKQRAQLGFLFSAGVIVGTIVSAGVTLGTFGMKTDWGWRIPSLVQVLPSLLQLTFMVFLPESPRWLISKGRGDEAFAIMAKYHAEGDIHSEFVKAEYTQIQKTIQLEREHSKLGWKHFIGSSGMRKRVLIGSVLGLFTQWSGIGLTSYLLPRILDQIGIHANREKNLISLALNIWTLIFAVALFVPVSKFKRRTMYLGSTTSMLVVVTAWTIANARYIETGSTSASITVLAFIALYSPAYISGVGALTYTYLVELFPFYSRAKGITVFQWFARMAAFLNQFINPIGLAHLGWKYYTIYIVWLAFEVLFVYFLFPETSDRTLEELVFLYEGDRIRDEQKERVQEEILHAESDVQPASDDRIAEA
ncbi:general substrate transporter [Mycena floridula]|nr:general substrate transporter [Mycena floridula]